MRGVVTTQASREWARARGFTGKLPVYNLEITNRPEYGATVVAGINQRNVRTIARLQDTLARIQVCTNGGISHA